MEKISKGICLTEDWLKKIIEFYVWRINEENFNQKS